MPFSGFFPFKLLKSVKGFAAVVPVSILIYAKTPIPGMVKTRLAKTVGNERAAQLAQAMLADTCQKLGKIAPANLWIAGDSVERGSAMEGELLREYRYWCQGKGSLGDRLRRGFEWRQAAADPLMIVVGGDTPHLPLRILQSAVELLRSCAENQGVLGKSEDGGFYLLGLPLPGASFHWLSDIKGWGEGFLFEETMTIARKNHLIFHQLEEFWDLDEADDLLRLKNMFPSLDPLALSAGCSSVTQTHRDAPIRTLQSLYRWDQGL